MKAAYIISCLPARANDNLEVAVKYSYQSPSSGEYVNRTSIIMIEVLAALEAHFDEITKNPPKVGRNESLIDKVTVKAMRIINEFKDLGVTPGIALACAFYNFYYEYRCLPEITRAPKRIRSTKNKIKNSIAKASINSTFLIDDTPTEEEQIAGAELAEAMTFRTPSRQKGIEEAIDNSAEAILAREEEQRMLDLEAMDMLLLKGI